jgi:PhoD-like phosphatase
VVAPHIGPDLTRAAQLVDGIFRRTLVRAFLAILLRSRPAGIARAFVAMARTNTPYNPDDFNGFGAERAAVLDVAKEYATNPIILGGDLHDSWAWILNEGGNMTGTPVAVNLGCPGVSSPGFGQAAYALLQPLERILGGPEEVYSLFDALFKQKNPSLVYADTRFKGFYAVKATKTTHTAEYIRIDPETILSNFTVARAARNGITAKFTCGASLVTTAGQRGSLVKQPACGAIAFDSIRPAEWSIPYPLNHTNTGLKKLQHCNMNACQFAVNP